MATVAIRGGPAPFREAVTNRLEAVEWDVVAGDDAAVVVHYCDSEAAWEELAASAASGTLGCVAIITRLDPALYRRAIALGAGAVHHDTSTEIIVQVISSALHGEALLPMHVARRLVSEPSSGQASGPDALDELERALLRGIVDGETIGVLGDRFHFSERTIRRRLQSAYLKLGVDDRIGAIRMVERDGLLD